MPWQEDSRFTSESCAKYRASRLTAAGWYQRVRVRRGDRRVPVAQLFGKPRLYVRPFIVEIWRRLI